MKTLVLEIRDRMTFIPALAVLIEHDNNYLLRRAGYGDPIVLLTHLQRNETCCDYYDWNDRTLQNAHKYIQENWDTLQDNDVVDVEFILGESKVKKLSERYTALLSF